MRVVFEAVHHRVSAGQPVRFPFELHNQSDSAESLRYKVEVRELGFDTSWCRVEAPATLGPGEHARGDLLVDLPRDLGRVAKTVPLRLTVGTVDNAAAATDECVLVVARPSSFRWNLTPDQKGGFRASVSYAHRERMKVDAAVGISVSQWRLRLENPQLTVQTSTGPVQVVGPSSPSVMPEVVLNHDGTVTAKVSLRNRGKATVAATVELRHEGGWSFRSLDSQVALRAGVGPVDVSVRYQPPAGERPQLGDHVTVVVRVGGVVVAEATVRISPHRSVIEVERRRRVSPWMLAVPVALLIAASTAAFVRSRGSGDGPASAAPIGQSRSTTTVAQATTQPVGRPGPAILPPPGATSTPAPPSSPGVPAPDEGRLVAAPASITFGDQPIATRGVAHTVTLSNVGEAAITVTTQRDGPHSGDFSLTADTCGGRSLQPRETCTVAIHFTPASEGRRNAALTMTTAPGSSPLTVPLTGFGTPQADLAVSLARPGDLVATVRNGGPSAATNVRLTVRFHDEDELQSVAPSEGSCSRTGSAPVIITCMFGTLDQGDSAELRMGTPCVPVAAEATVGGREHDVAPANNRAAYGPADCGGID